MQRRLGPIKPYHPIYPLDKTEIGIKKEIGIKPLSFPFQKIEMLLTK
jgi:hypothetical protein